MFEGELGWAGLGVGWMEVDRGGKVWKGWKGVTRVESCGKCWKGWRFGRSDRGGRVDRGEEVKRGGMVERGRGS